MKPFDNCYIVKDTTKKTIKIIKMDNKTLFVNYIVESLDFKHELEITTGLIEDEKKGGKK